MNLGHCPAAADNGPVSFTVAFLNRYVFPLARADIPQKIMHVIRGAEETVQLLKPRKCAEQTKNGNFHTNHIPSIRQTGRLSVTACHHMHGLSLVQNQVDVDGP